MTSNRGHFVVLEGLDGSGTTTQARRLHDHLVQRGLQSWLTFEPTDGPVGQFIRKSLARGPGSGENAHSDLSEAALCLLFAADRIEHSRRIERERDGGRLVVSDRYLLSSIAYQSRDPSIPPERVIEVNRGCAVPTVTLFLRVPVAECLRRLDKRSDSPTIYEKKDLLVEIDRNYATTRSLYEKGFGPVVDIDGTASEDDVHSAIVESLAVYLDR